MKKIIALILLLCTFTLMLSSCGSEKIEKPEDTNLEYWLLDKLDTDNAILLKTFYGSELYLDSKYQPIIDEDGNYSKPENCVVYYIKNYPLADLGITKRISAIVITDPKVNMFGLTLHSTQKEVVTALERNGFTISFSAGRIYGELGRYTVTVAIGEAMSISYETPSIIASLWSIDLD